MVIRHGNYTMIDENYFIVDGENENYDVIRIVEHFKTAGILFISSLNSNNGIVINDTKLIKPDKFELNIFNDEIMLPSISSIDIKLYNDFDLITNDWLVIKSKIIIQLLQLQNQVLQTLIF